MVLGNPRPFFQVPGSSYLVLRKSPTVWHGRHLKPANDRFLLGKTNLTPTGPSFLRELGMTLFIPSASVSFSINAPPHLDRLWFFRSRAGSLWKGNGNQV